MQRVSEQEFKDQYREYVRRLESLTSTEEKKHLEMFLDPSNHHLYKDIEAIISVMARGALLISVESVVESWISIMEHHASQRRTLGEMMLHEEMVIAINGPILVHCDVVVQVTNCLFMDLHHLERC